MKIFYLLLFAFCILLAKAQNPCYTDQYWAHAVQRDSSLLTQRNLLEKELSKWANQSAPVVTSHTKSLNNQPTYVIPTVIYIVYGSHPASNISMQQIQSQMDQLNANFEAYGYRFCYAKKDVTTGAAFTPATGDSAGVFRINNSTLSDLDEYTEDAQLKALSALPWQSYMRIFVVNSITPNGVLGYALLPGSGSSLDGIVMRYDVFGSNNYCAACQLYPDYNLGASLTHEAGHFLNLYHTFQGACSTSAGPANQTCAYNGDWVCDTPPTAGEFGCPSPAPLSCNGVDTVLTNNYMDYTNDPCKSAFTSGQASRMNFGVNAYRTMLVSDSNLINTGVTCVSLGNAYSKFYCRNFDDCVNKPMTFTANLSSGLYTYNWNFGDGTTTTGTTVTHTFTAAGKYNVTLNVSSSNLNINSSTTIPVFIDVCSPITCEVNKWDGNYAYLDFSSGTPVATLHSPTYSVGGWFYGNFYRANTAGQPLFHLPVTLIPKMPLFDSSFVARDSIQPGSEWQILHLPSSPNKFCILANLWHVSDNGAGTTDSIYYCYVNATGDNVSAIPNKRFIKIQNTGGSGMGVAGITSIPNCDGTKFWIIAYFNNGKFNVFEMNQNDTVIVHQLYNVPGIGRVYQLVASPDGRMLTTGYDQGHSALCLLNFDKSTGMITGYNIIHPTALANLGYWSDMGKVCFSPNSKFLYVSDVCCNSTTSNTGYLYQLDVHSSDPWASKRPIFEFPRWNNGSWSPEQLFSIGPDNKIYVGHFYQPGNSAPGYRLGVINYPDVLENGLHNTGYNNNGPDIVPQNCPYFYGEIAYVGHDDQTDAYGCLWQPGTPTPPTFVSTSCRTYKFYSDDCFTHTWNFGDPTSGANNTSTLGEPTHVFSGPGIYHISMVANGVTFNDTITITAPPLDLTSTPIVTCPAPHANYSIANLQPGVTYQWAISNGSPSAVNSATNVDVAWTQGDTTGAITIYATDNNSGCKDTSTFHFSFNGGNTGTYSYAFNICDGQSYQFGGRLLTTAGQYSDTLTGAGGCDSIVYVQLTVVQPAPATISLPKDTFCGNEASVQLSGTPTGGTFSGSGVSNGEFNPANATIGTDTISYTYNNNGCVSTATKIVHVYSGTHGSVTVDSLWLAAGVTRFTAHPNNADSYQWQVAIDTNGNASNLQSASNQADINCIGSEYVRVILNYNGSCSDTSNWFTLNNCTTGVDDVSGITNLSIYPNPANNKLFISYQLVGAQTMELDIVDITGKKLFATDKQNTHSLQTTEIDVSQFATGVYVIQLITGQGTVNRKFLKE